MEDVSSATLGVGHGDLGALLDDGSKFVENHKAKEANTNVGDKVSTFATSAPTTSCLGFHSTRIVNMMTNRSEFETECEFWIAHSKVHWSELSHPKGASHSDDPGVDHCPYFEKLQKDAHWGKFCSQVTNVVLGRKLGEGAQANIYEAQVTFASNEEGPWIHEESEHVVKLMKDDCALKDLQRQWPHGLKTKLPSILLSLYGALVKEPGMERSKFGFVMPRYWGDLRSLIDLRIEHKNAKGPPFSLLQVHHLMYQILIDMLQLVGRGIRHRNLKASNMLVYHNKEKEDIVSSNHPKLITPYVADWECSVGVVGMGWWRAPEILLQLKNKTPSSKFEFNEEMDVYSFAITCYEIARGLLPFEGHPYCRKLRDDILHGVRPKLPHDLDLEIRAIITSCWDPNPTLRHSFFNLIPIIKPSQC